MRIYQGDYRAKSLIDKALGCDLAQPFSGLVIVDDNDKIHGAAVFNNFEPGLTVDVTFVGRLSPATARGIFRYAFRILKVRRVTAVTRVSNKAARAGLVRLGFAQEGLLRDRYENEDGLIYGLIPADAKLRF